jgi:hypothetical protein
MLNNTFIKYTWLFDILYNRTPYGGITYDEISEKWKCSVMNDTGEPLLKRTFYRDRITIEEIFSISIGCNKEYKYFIENIEDVKNNKLQMWLLSTFSVNVLLAESKELMNRILLENNPSSQIWLSTILQSMKEDVRLFINYQAFGRNYEKEHLIEPYGLKVFKQRWYLLANNLTPVDEGNEIKIFSLDRIHCIKKSEKKFKFPKDFNIEKFFASFYGVFTNESPEVIRIKALGDTTKYLKSLPLHQSQKLIEENEEFSVFEYYIAPTFDFIQEIIKNEENLIVTYPDSLRIKIVGIIDKMKKNYED